MLIYCTHSHYVSSGCFVTHLPSNHATEEHRKPKKALQQTIHCKRWIQKPRKWEGGVREDATILLGKRTWKTKVKDREPWGQHTEEAKAQMGCNTIAAAASSPVFPTNACRKTPLEILYILWQCGNLLHFKDMLHILCFIFTTCCLLYHDFLFK
jgi:hypothetical protein